MYNIESAVAVKILYLCYLGEYVYVLFSRKVLRRESTVSFFNSKCYYSNYYNYYSNYYYYYSNYYNYYSNYYNYYFDYYNYYINYYNYYSNYYDYYSNYYNYYFDYYNYYLQVSSTIVSKPKLHCVFRALSSTIAISIRLQWRRTIH